MRYLKPIEAGDIADNTFRLIGKDWMLITAGEKNSFNTMTASWGGLGVLWNKQVCFIFIRPQRHTFQFAGKYDRFTLSFFREDQRNILNFCGANSGRDVDKVKMTGLAPLETPSGAVAFEQARLIIECRKIYFQDLNPENFLDPGIGKNYSVGDYHRMFIGEIVSCYT